jgi:hypothetical protein
MTGNGSDDTDAKPPKRKASARKQPFARSRYGNGKELLSGVDQRSLTYREYQDAVADLTSHMGGEPTTVQQAIIEQAAGLMVWQRFKLAETINGQPLDVTAYCTAANTLLHLLREIGQERRAKDVTIQASHYIAMAAQQ